MEFLKTSPDWALGEDGMRRVARRVAFHCPGSAARFIRVGRLLGEVGTSGADAVKTAIRYAELDDSRTERFIALFKNLYLEEKLDLDIATSAKLANELSADFAGTLPGVEREFARLSEFCSTDEGLGQSRPQCARFAAHVVAGAKDQSPGVFERWKTAYDFLASEPGPKLPTAAAATLASEVVASGEAGTDSFIQAYRYALSSQGLRLERGGALDFSRQLVLAELAPSGARGTATDPVIRTETGVQPAAPVTISTASRRPAGSRPKKRSR